jgi:hypothetical protein
LGPLSPGLGCRSKAFRFRHPTRRSPAAEISGPKVLPFPQPTFYNPPRPMVHNVTLFKLKPEITPPKLEQMMMTTRMTLLKIPEILSVKCGKSVDPKAAWPFFIALDFESMEKLAMTEEDAIYMKFTAEVIKPNTAERLTLNYEMDPGKNVKYS